jgi:hypothetical protein
LCFEHIGAGPTELFSLEKEWQETLPMTKHKQDKSRTQKALRRRRNERAFLFDKNLTHCLGGFDRGGWEFAISDSGGDVVAAGLECGITNIPKGAKALWGRSAEEALGTYRRWQKKKQRK